jgi:hypothetical protein
MKVFRFKKQNANKSNIMTLIFFFGSAKLSL